VAACGRRFGKTLLAIDRLLHAMALGMPVAYFAPTYKLLSDTWREIRGFVTDIMVSKSETERRLEIIGGGTLDMWSLQDENAGRGRRYGRIIVDEAGLVPDLERAWNENIRPTLTDLHGDAWFLGTPKGRNYYRHLFSLGAYHGDAGQWRSWRMPTSANPYMDPAEIEAARLGMPERAFRQEYLAEFIEESGGVFRKVYEAIDTGRTEPDPPLLDNSYVLGVDLARTQDFTVLTIVDNTGKQVYFERFQEISWERQIAAITRAANQYGARVVIDSTGVGDPIFERLRWTDVVVEDFQFTARSKERLIDSLAMALEAGNLRLMDIPVQTNELLAYQYELTAYRHVRMNAPVGMHDDCVIALALASYRQPVAPIEIGFLDTGPVSEKDEFEEEGWVSV